MTVNQVESTGDLRFEIWEPGRKQHELRVMNLLRRKEWAHLAAVSGPNGAKLYFTENLLASNSFTGSFASVQNGQHNYLGRNNWKSEMDWIRDFQGQMDEVRVWKIARTAADIRANRFAKLTGREPDLVRLWNFDTATNGVVQDLSPGRHDGKLVGNARIVPGRLPQLTTEPSLLTGRITGTDGKSAAAAEVTAFENGTEVQRAQTTATGDFRLRIPSGIGSLQLVASQTNNLATAKVTALKPAERREVNLTLSPPGSILGRITDPESKALAAVQGCHSATV